CRLYPVPADHGSFPTLFRESVPGCWTPYPGGTPCARACCFHSVIGLPQVENRSASRVCPRITTSRGVAFRGCRYSVMFRPPSLLAPQIVPTAANTPTGQPGLLRPGTSCFVTSARTGYANRPIQAIGGAGTCTLLDSQPCRLLRRDRIRARLAVGEGFPLPLFRLRDGVTVSPWHTFLEAPLKSRTVGFAESGSKAWHVLREPSPGLERFKRWFVYTPAILVCPQPRLLKSSSAYRRFYQAGRLDDREDRQAPEPLCPTRVLPPLGRRDPSPGRAFPLRRRSYWLMRRSRWSLSSFGIQPRSESPCRLYPVPADHGSFPTLFRESVPGCWTPYPGGTPCARACCFHSVIGLPQVENRSASRVCPGITTSRGVAFRGCRYSVMFRPPSLLAPQIVPTAANTPTGQPGLLRPGTSCFVTSARTGYANRPIQAIGGAGTCTLLDS